MKLYFDAVAQGCPTFRLWRAGLISSLAWRATMQYRPMSRRCLNVNFNNVVICRVVSLEISGNLLITYASQLFPSPTLQSDDVKY